MERRREEDRQAEGRDAGRGQKDSHLVKVDAGTGRKGLPGLGVHVDGDPGGHDAMGRRLAALVRGAGDKQTENTGCNPPEDAEDNPPDGRKEDGCG